MNLIARSASALNARYSEEVAQASSDRLKTDEQTHRHLTDTHPGNWELLLGALDRYYYTSYNMQVALIHSFIHSFFMHIVLYHT